MKKTASVATFLFVSLISVTSLFAADVWLDDVFSFIKPTGSSTDANNPAEAFGADDNGYVSIDTPETLILAFSDNTAFDGSGDDLRIREYGNDGARANVYGSEDGSNWTFLVEAVASGSGSGNYTDILIDLNGTGLSYVNYLKFEGLDDLGTVAGFDLDAVEALNSGDHFFEIPNVALGKPVTVTTNGAEEDNPGCTDVYPSDITDGDLDYTGTFCYEDDGCIAYQNQDYDELMVLEVTIDLQGVYAISKIRYNVGNVHRSPTWNADYMTTPLGRTTTNPGPSNYNGAWTEHQGMTIASEITITLEKTRTSWATDILSIGEIEIYGIPAETLGAGDFDHDRDIDGLDLSKFLAAFGSVAGSPDFNVNADFNGDSEIDEADLSVISFWYGTSDAPVILHNVPVYDQEDYTDENSPTYIESVANIQAGGCVPVSFAMMFIGQLRTFGPSGIGIDTSNSSTNTINLMDNITERLAVIDEADWWEFWNWGDTQTVINEEQVWQEMRDYEFIFDAPEHLVNSAWQMDYFSAQSETKDFLINFFKDKLKEHHPIYFMADVDGKNHASVVTGYMKMKGSEYFRINDTYSTTPNWYRIERNEGTYIKLYGHGKTWTMKWGVCKTLSVEFFAQPKF